MMPRIAKVINAFAANKCNGQEKKINSIRFSLNMQRKPIEWLWKSNSMLNGGSIPQRKLSHSLSFSLTTILREINRTRSGGWHLLAYKVIINLCYFYLSLLQSNLLARRIKRLEISQSVNIIARCISEFIPFNLVHSQLPHNFASVYEESTVYGGTRKWEIEARYTWSTHFDSFCFVWRFWCFHIQLKTQASDRLLTIHLLAAAFFLLQLKLDTQTMSAMLQIQTNGNENVREKNFKNKKKRTHFKCLISFIFFRCRLIQSVN